MEFTSSMAQATTQHKEKNKERVTHNTPTFGVGKAKRTKPHEAEAIARTAKAFFKRDDKFFITEIFFKIII